MKLFHAQLILYKLIDTLEGMCARVGGVSASHQVITLSISIVGRITREGQRSEGLTEGEV